MILEAIEITRECLGGGQIYYAGQRYHAALHVASVDNWLRNLTKTLPKGSFQNAEVGSLRARIMQ